MMIIVLLPFRMLSRTVGLPVDTREQASENHPLLQDMIEPRRHMREVNLAQQKLGGKDRYLPTSNATPLAK